MGEVGEVRTFLNHFSCLQSLPHGPVGITCSHRTGMFFMCQSYSGNCWAQR